MTDVPNSSLYLRYSSSVHDYLKKGHDAGRCNSPNLFGGFTGRRAVCPGDVPNVFELLIMLADHWARAGVAGRRPAIPNAMARLARRTESPTREWIATSLRTRPRETLVVTRSRFNALFRSSCNVAARRAARAFP